MYCHRAGAACGPGRTEYLASAFRLGSVEVVEEEERAHGTGTPAGRRGEVPPGVPACS